jgi:hypothetical protein
MGRPAEIKWFERIIAVTLLLGIIQSWLAWPQLVALRGPAFLLTTQLLTLAVLIGLTLAVSRRRSNIAKWIMIGLFVVGLPIVVKLASTELLTLGSPLIKWVQFVGQLLAYALLFTRGSRRWFRGEGTLG